MESFLYYFKELWVIVGPGVGVLLTLVAQYIFDKRTTRNQVLFENMHSGRLVAVKAVYENIAKAYEMIRNEVSPLQYIREDEKIRAAWEAAGEQWDSARACFVSNKIYFDTETASKIDTLTKEMLSNWNKYLVAETQLKHTHHGHADRTEAWAAYSKTIPELLNDIENKFKVIIGID